MEFRLSADETACIKKLAEKFEKNETWINYGSENNHPDPLNLPSEKREAILSLMEQMGVINEVRHSSEYRFFLFRISPQAIQAARLISEQENKKEEPRDIVEQVKTTIRSNRIMAWVIVAFFALAALVTLLNQLLQILKTLGVLKAN
jgi:hypothetical protein